MAAVVLLVLLVGAVFAPRHGVDSRPEFTGRPDWRGEGA